MVGTSAHEHRRGPQCASERLWEHHAAVAEVGRTCSVRLSSGTQPLLNITGQGDAGETREDGHSLLVVDTPSDRQPRLQNLKNGKELF